MLCWYRPMPDCAEEMLCCEDVDSSKHMLFTFMQYVPKPHVHCKYKRASTRENLSSEIFEQHRRRPACASAQIDQRLCYSLTGYTHYLNSNLIWHTVEGDPMVKPHPRDVILYARSSYYYDNMFIICFFSDFKTCSGL